MKKFFLFLICGYFREVKHKFYLIETLNVGLQSKLSENDEKNFPKNTHK